MNHRRLVFKHFSNRVCSYLIGDVRVAFYVFSLFLMSFCTAGNGLSGDRQTIVADTLPHKPAPSDAILCAFESLSRHGSNALILKSNDGFVAVAVGVGSYHTRSEVEGNLPDALKRFRAVRVAVVSAKAALAEQLGAATATSVESAISGSDSNFIRSEATVSFGRTVLSRSQIWHTEATPEGTSYSAKAWIYFSDCSESINALAKSGGVPCFLNNHLAANAMVEWISSGLCDAGAMKFLVGIPGEEKLRSFAAGLAPSGPSAQRVAEMKASASLMRENSSSVETIEGAKSLVRQTSITDPLSSEGNRSIVTEEFFKSRTSTASGVVRIATGPLVKHLPNGLTCVVVWEAD